MPRRRPGSMRKRDENGRRQASGGRKSAGA